MLNAVHPVPAVIARYFIVLMVLAGSLLLFVGPSDAQTEKKPPYWVSISKAEARMRVGPSMDYPANWVYQRRNLPLRVLAIYPNWRKVEDPDGTQGWMHVRLLKDDPTAIVRGTAEVAMRDAPNSSGRPIFRVQPGVVGRVTDCARGWCAFDVNGQRGFIESRHLWGATDAG